jgi:hypothetical protein
MADDKQSYDALLTETIARHFAAPQLPTAGARCEAGPRRAVAALR